MSELNFREDVLIDPERLDIEWLRQPELVAHYGEALAEAKDETRRAHQRVKLVRSELILKAKRGMALEECGTKKPSDSVCEAYYRTDPEHVEAVDAFMDAQKEEDALQQAVYAMTGRRSALEHLVRLLISEYFTSPLEAHDISTFSYEDFGKKMSEEKAAAKVETTERMARKTKPRRSRRTT